LLLLTVHLVIQQQFRIFMSTYKWRLSLWTWHLEYNQWIKEWY
jgi:hypothetical protein